MEAPLTLAQRFVLILSFLAAVILALPAMGAAQGDYLIFPQVADGFFDDGSFYGATLNIKHWQGSLETTVCELDFYGMDADFGTGRSNAFDVTVPRG
jgi:hypothetical protein